MNGRMKEEEEEEEESLGGFDFWGLMGRKGRGGTVTGIKFTEWIAVQ